MNDLGSRTVGWMYVTAVLAMVFVTGFGQPLTALAEEGATATSGQTQGTGQIRRAIHGIKLKKNGDVLTLNAEQKKKMKALVDDKLEQMKAEREDKSLSNEQKRVKFRQIRETTNDKFKEILTPEQLVTYENNIVKKQKYREMLQHGNRKKLDNKSDD